VKLQIEKVKGRATRRAFKQSSVNGLDYSSLIHSSARPNISPQKASDVFI
jgi:hypothetical protein